MAVIDPRPADETAALVQNWMRQSISAAHVQSCTNSGATDQQVGGIIWACRLWYVRRQRYATLCVAVEEHVVRRKIGAGDPAAARGVACEGKSETNPIFDGAW